MKIAAVIVYFTFIATYVYADSKWIPIEPIKTNEVSKTDSNTSKLRPANTWVENLRVIQRLLDNKNKDNVTAEDKKSWYSLDNGEND